MQQYRNCSKIAMTVSQAARAPFVLFNNFIKDVNAPITLTMHLSSLLWVDVC